MSQPDPALLRKVERYYSERVRTHGATARGVDWNSEESQELRFEQLAKLWLGESTARELSIIDYGCGYGALRDYLNRTGVSASYQGLDISEAMIHEARARAGAGALFTTDVARLVRADFVVASGIFNVKLDASTTAWEDHVRHTVDAMAALATRGLAFNALTSFSDSDRRRDDLYYAEPAYWFDYCQRRHSRFVALLHDYPLYEFTLLVRHASAEFPSGVPPRTSQPD